MTVNNDKKMTVNNDKKMTEKEYNSKFQEIDTFSPDEDDSHLSYSDENWPNEYDKYKEFDEEECKSALRDLDKFIYCNRDDVDISIKEIGDYIRLCKIDSSPLDDNIDSLITIASSMLSRTSCIKSKDLMKVSELLILNIIEVFIIERNRTLDEKARKMHIKISEVRKNRRLLKKIGG